MPEVDARHRVPKRPASAPRPGTAEASDNARLRPMAPQRAARKATVDPGAELRRLRRALIPIRIFLGGTFLYAGLDKLTDPAFLNATGPGSIGSQLQSFLYVSPLAPLVRAFAIPAPVAVGALIAVVEIAVGVCALTGLVFRMAAFGGLVLSALFWLTASWGTSPYYYGADLPYGAGWLLLLLAGDGGFSLAGRLERYLPTDPGGPRPIGEVLSRREAIRLGLEAAVIGVVALSIGGIAWVVSGGPTRQAVRRGARTGVPEATAVTEASPPAAVSLPVASPGATSSAADSAVALMTDVRAHEALAVTDPITGDPAFLFRLASNRVVCYNALCTHEGCPVEFDVGSELLVCPCHGAVFDPAHGARVLSGPTRLPLPELPLSIDPVTGAITITA